MTSENRDYYQILGVSSDASFEEIRTAFRERAREFHPDRNSSPDAVERMQEINEAYEVLRDEEQRAAYDRMHRTFGVSAEELTRAKVTAAMVLGHMAFGLGFAIGARISNHWTERIHRLEDIPTGVWHAGYEVTLESALTGRSESEIRQAALDAAWHAVQFESARLAYRHALAERSPTFTESFAVDIEVNILGSTAAVIGFALGRQNIQESLPASVWAQADEAIRRSVTTSIQLRGGVVTPQTLRDNAFINSVFDNAAQEANRVLRPHSEAIGRRIGRSPNRGGRVASSGSAGDGCVTILGRVFGIALVGLMILGIVLYLGSLGEPDYNSVTIGDCIDETEYLLTQCSTPGSLRVVAIHRYPPDGAYPGLTRLRSDSEVYCPAYARTFVYPTIDSWGDGDRTLLCVP